jgi:hypothetical protein
LTDIYGGFKSDMARSDIKLMAYWRGGDQSSANYKTNEIESMAMDKQHTEETKESFC